jgi:hypothetical protein
MEGCLHVQATQAAGVVKLTACSSSSGAAAAAAAAAKVDVHMLLLVAKAW